MIQIHACLQDFSKLIEGTTTIAPALSFERYGTKIFDQLRNRTQYGEGGFSGPRESRTSRLFL